jgi:DNA-binding ferritin-like protein (Dps family)
VSEGKMWSVGRKEALIYDVRKKLNDELKVGYKDLFNMLVKALKNHEKSKYNSINSFLWDVMGDDILEVIPLHQDYLVWDDTGSTEENESVEILGKNVVFEWRKRKIEV